MEQITLENDFVRLEPLRLEHKDAISKAVLDGHLYTARFISAPAPNDEVTYITNALKKVAEGTSLACVVIDPKTGAVIGSTRLYNYEEENAHIMLGYTWYAKSYQGTLVNPSCKLLLLQHAFEILKCAAVEFQVDSINLQSQAAVKKLGAKQDGVLRNHKRRKDGTFRDTVSFSITDYDWMEVKTKLLQRLAKT